MPRHEDIVVPASKAEVYAAHRYSPGVRAGNLLLVSGQTGLLPDGSMPSGLTEQSEAALASIAETLSEAGLTFADVASLTTYHVGDIRTDIWDFVAVKDRHFPEPYPAWTAVEVSGLAHDGAQIEVAVTAVLR